MHSIANGKRYNPRLCWQTPVGLIHFETGNIAGYTRQGLIFPE